MALRTRPFQDLAALCAFLKAPVTGSTTEAASRLGLTQPAIPSQRARSRAMSARGSLLSPLRLAEAG